jgi:hypothetical protein
MTQQSSNPPSDVDKRYLEIEEKRLVLEVEKQKFEQRFANRHLATLITAAISVLAICMSVAQILLHDQSTRQEAEKVRKQQVKDRELEARRQDRDWSLQWVRLVLDHRKEVFSRDIATQRQFRALIVAVFPDYVAAPIFQRLADVQRDRAAEAHGTKSSQQAQKIQAASEDVWAGGRRAAQAASAERSTTALLVALASVSPRVTVDLSKTPVAYKPADLFSETFDMLGFGDDQVEILKAQLRMLLPNIPGDIDRLPANSNVNIGTVAQYLRLSLQASGEGALP